MQQTIMTHQINLLSVQALDVISVNVWHIVVSLLNLVLLFLIVKKFLFKPIKKILVQRKQAVDEQYKKAQEALDCANESKNLWEEKINDAKEEADVIVKEATSLAFSKGEQIVFDASKKADAIISRAKEEASLEMKKARSKIKEEIVDVSTALAEKMLEREINKKDHDKIFESVIGRIGDGDEADS